MVPNLNEIITDCFSALGENTKLTLPRKFLRAS
jgi:hypothetical protein